MVYHWLNVVIKSNIDNDEHKMFRPNDFLIHYGLTTLGQRMLEDYLITDKALICRHDVETIGTLKSDGNYHIKSVKLCEDCLKLEKTKLWLKTTHNNFTKFRGFAAYTK